MIPLSHFFMCSRMHVIVPVVKLAMLNKHTHLIYSADVLSGTIIASVHVAVGESCDLSRIPREVLSVNRPKCLLNSSQAQGCSNLA